MVVKMDEKKELKKREKSEKKALKAQKKERTPMEKARRKKIRKRCIWGGIAAVVVILIAVAAMGGGDGTTVETTTAYLGDIEQTVSTSGTVKSQETKNYFAPLSIRVEAVNVESGDKVQKGDVLLAYDAEALELEKQIAELRIEAGQGNYDSSVNQNNQYIAKLKEADFNLDVLNRQITDCENYVNDLKQKINEKRAELSSAGANLQMALIDCEKEQGVDSDDYRAISKEIQRNLHEQQNNEEILYWQKEIERNENMIAGFKTYQAEMKSQKSVSESSTLDNGGQRQLEADTELEILTNNSRLNAIDRVEDGIVADFTGIVTEVDILEGATPMEGAKLITLESTEKVKIAFTVTKYDLEKIALGQEAKIEVAGGKYTGRITKIDGMATVNDNGVAVVGAEIEVDNPDENIYLGIEAKLVIYTKTVANVVLVPVGAVNSDINGDFVYVVENGIAVRRDVVVGISTDTSCEIQEGLNAGEQVILTGDQDIEDGMAVSVS